jgi:pimeloyl-ACP methyl ester carboxylesterase
MMSHYIFRDVLQPLAVEHDLIAIDLPGFGESDRPPPHEFSYDIPGFAQTVREVLDRLGVARAAVLGHSMGGAVALALTARSPERVSRAILVCPVVYPLPLPAEERLLMSPVGALLWKHVVNRALVGRLWRARHVRDPRSVTDAWLDYYWARLNRAGGRDAAYAAGLALSRVSEAPADPARVRAPTLLVWPEEDRVVPLAHGKRLATAIAGSRLAVVPACGHDVFLERPDEFVRQVAPFLAEDARAERSAS